jgi:hypothetical protein
MTNIIALSTNKIKNIQKLNTPQTLKTGMYLTWGASFLLLLATITGIQGQRHAIQTIGKDTAPSIISAQRIKDSLADMDASVANELLTKTGVNKEALQNYEDRRQKLADFIVSAAQNITYGDAERQPIITLQLNLGRYMEKVQKARDFNAFGNKEAATLAAYREAAEIMDKTLIPAADALNKANQQELERTYAQEQFSASKSLFLIIVSGLLVTATLVSLQIVLSRRTKRTLNIPLLAATFITSSFLFYTIISLISASENLRLAKEDAFTSIYALRQSRALAYSANGDESRYLLDAAFSQYHEQSFFNKTSQLMKLPNGQSLETVITASAKGQKVPGFTGLFADALNNITFDGEREATVKTLSTFNEYLKIDSQIRQLYRSGRIQEAIALCIGNNQGQSNWAFEEFKNAHQKTMDINKAEFDKAVEKGFQNVNGFEVTAPIAMSGVVFLTLFGLRPRLKEYSR